MQKILASIIITNYNYGSFLSEAIESALNQIYQPTEIIVVDDGSTDNSQQIIASYGEKIVPVLKDNGGQASAFNAGFAISYGEVICFLDSDDVLLPSAIERAVKSLCDDPDAVKVHWPLRVIDINSNLLEKVDCEGILPEGNLYNEQLKYGLEGHTFPPTSGNVWLRSYLEKILPMPETNYRLNAESYLGFLAPFSGSIRRINEYQSLYRIHGHNGTNKRTYSWRLSHYYYEEKVLREYLHKQGIKVNDAFEYKEDSCHKYLQRMVELGKELGSLIAQGQNYILVDMDELGHHQLLENCQAIPFLEKEGVYWGPPSGDTVAIKEFERLHREGASCIVFAWPAFWWLDYYAEFVRYLRTKFRCLLENERLVVFDLHTLA
ncbi:glycosyltransferase family 2 protein [Nostoc sp. UHCC 0251]|uniref:glycosyltransferase family 2 protein n=1 Tax=Nostoc sp. UHCC 0251 TaxID=3110240 RepID=UPI002B1FB51F|nr:glycosyltransferase family 2 protein [Nostoc sp. UHCC 0251]MEA5626110.1 glycosyltransferase family 2 protein [Nostoc sp. UHCC 0251]